MQPPKFALCPAIHEASCSIGALPAYQAYELVVTDLIGKNATPGQQVSLTVDVQGQAAPPASGLSPAEATITTLVGSPTTSPSPVDSGGAGDGSSLPSIPGFPGTTISPSGLSSLFPVVTPSPTPSNGKASGKRKVTKATSTASSLPIDPRLIGGQLAGLAVLMAAITMVVARLSLRTPQVVGPSAPAKSPEPPAPSAPAEADTAVIEPAAKPE